MKAMLRGALVFSLAAFAIVACSSSSTGLSNGPVGVPPSAPPSASPTPAGAPYDDWIEFAHDNLHTGFQPQSTGISNATVKNLVLRWKVTVPNGQSIYASPLVYGGDVFVVTDPPHAVMYDLSAADGHVVWSYQSAGGVRATPTIDTSAGLIIFGDRLLDSSGNPIPSHLYALHISDGTPAWITTIPGNTHQGPIVAGGVVYQGTSGGDAPACLNGGVTAVDELTGATKWTWSVNSSVNPGGGGSAWGAIAYDGARLIFGTGNTCGSAKYLTADGAVALDLNGHLLWDFVAQQNSYWDYDTGGGVMISNGQAIFKNKTGYLYSLNAQTGALVRSTMIDPNYGYGEFPSPSTDGSVTMIGWGLNPNTSGASPARRTDAYTHSELERIERVLRHPGRHAYDSLAGYHSSLTALNSSGAVLWNHTMNAMLDGYAAIVNGVVFADDDNALSAFDERNGTKLWTYALPNPVDASPAVVPSGVYTADEGGNVYAFSLP